MMRRLVFCLIIISAVISFAVSCSRSEEGPKTEAKIFYVDAEITRLLPYYTQISDTDMQHQAEAVINELIMGRDDNDKIRRLIPKRKGCVTVRTEGNIAYVDLESAIAEELPKSRDIEKLVIYQIVNSLTDIRGLRFVRFTVDGEIRKDFMGYYDMRETYKYVYPE